jgi:hypothetical protein
LKIVTSRLPEAMILALLTSTVRQAPLSAAGPSQIKGRP